MGHTARPAKAYKKQTNKVINYGKRWNKRSCRNR